MRFQITEAQLDYSRLEAAIAWNEAKAKTAKSEDDRNRYEANARNARSDLGDLISFDAFFDIY